MIGFEKRIKNIYNRVDAKLTENKEKLGNEFKNYSISPEKTNALLTQYTKYKILKIELEAINQSVTAPLIVETWQRFIDVFMLMIYIRLAEYLFIDKQYEIRNDVIAILDDINEILKSLLIDNMSIEEKKKKEIKNILLINLSFIQFEQKIGFLYNHDIFALFFSENNSLIIESNSLIIESNMGGKKSRKSSKSKKSRKSKRKTKRTK